MNKQQRVQNRANAKELSRHILANSLCPECGEKGAHWMQTGIATLQNILDGTLPDGFWTCAKFYGADGRRIEP